MYSIRKGMGIVQGAYARSFQEGLADIGTDIIGSGRPVMEADEVVIMVITTEAVIH